MEAYQIAEDLENLRRSSSCGSIPKDAVAAAIRSTRKRLGLTQGAFSKTLSVQQSAVSRLENGQLKPSVQRLIQLLRMARTDGERNPIVAALGQRGILASDLATSISAMAPLHEDSTRRPAEGCNVRAAEFSSGQPEAPETGRSAEKGITI